MVKHLDWHNLYSESWKNEIAPAAFQHPAKYSRALIRYIYEYLIKEKMVKPGDVVLDPFGGVALGGLDAARLGLHFIGCELEPKFVDLGNQNITLWNARYAGKMPRWGSARLVQGDSRHLRSVIAAAECAVSSPPYSGTEMCGNRRELTKYDNGEKRQRDYGSTQGNLGNLPEGDYRAAISSPPYERSPISAQGADGKSQEWNNAYREYVKTGDYSSFQVQMTKKCDAAGYSPESDNLGNTRGDDFWSAARQVVAETYAVLAPGAVAVWVVKDFIRNKARVPFCEQWRQLCEACGFNTYAIARAWLVEDHGTQLAMDGNHKHKQTERKSFFRRLAERKGSPRIDFETVLIMRKR